MKLEAGQLRDLIRLLHEESVREFEYEDDEQRIKLRLDGGMPAVTQVPIHHGATDPVPVRLEEIDLGTTIKSPLVGTFFRAPSPDASPFVDVGSRVKRGQVLCIVEAMKLMNEIECETSGIVREILVVNGAPVEFGQALFRIQPE